MGTHSSILAWRISWTEEPGRLQSMGLQRVGHNWVTNTFGASQVVLVVKKKKRKKERKKYPCQCGGGGLVAESCPSPAPRACSNSCQLSWWCHPTISSSAASFSFCLQSLPESGSFTVSWLFMSGELTLYAWHTNKLFRNLVVCMCVCVVGWDRLGGGLYLVGW